MTDRFDAVPVRIANEARELVRVVLLKHLRFVDALTARLYASGVERAHDGSTRRAKRDMQLPSLGRSRRS